MSYPAPPPPPTAAVSEPNTELEPLTPVLVAVTPAAPPAPIVTVWLTPDARLCDAKCLNPPAPPPPPAQPPPAPPATTQQSAVKVLLAVNVPDDRKA